MLRPFYVMVRKIQVAFTIFVRYLTNVIVNKN